MSYTVAKLTGMPSSLFTQALAKSWRLLRHLSTLLDYSSRVLMTHGVCRGTFIYFVHPDHHIARRSMSTNSTAPLTGESEEKFIHGIGISDPSVIRAPSPSSY